MYHRDPVECDVNPLGNGSQPRHEHISIEQAGASARAATASNLIRPGGKHRKRHRSKLGGPILGKEQRLLDYQAELKTLTLELTLAQEKERRRIALGLHDDVGHSLALARMKLGAYRRAGPGDVDDELAEVHELINHAIQATRTLTFDLSSPILYELGLEPALQSLGERVLESNDICFAFDTDRASKPLSLEASLVLYRSVEELLYNVVKHARAGRVRVMVSRVEHRIEIGVADDGVGFDFAEVRERGGRGRGYGVLSIREQLHTLGGHLDMDTAPGQGTKSLLVAPLESPEQ